MCLLGKKLKKKAFVMWSNIKSKCDQNEKVAYLIKVFAINMKKLLI